MAGETETGVTIMRIVKALDAGPMIATSSRPIGPDETSVEIERDLARIGAKTLVQSVDAIAEGRAIETPQDDSRATYANKIERIDGVVDWSKSASAIHNQIRGLHPWPHAFSDLDGERTILLRSEVERGTPHPSGPPGIVLEAHGDRFVVQAGEDALRLITLQREGRRPMSAREFLAGRRHQRGARFLRFHSS
jgi:methionyl-tRNA formyltransferase